jgi:hypothetical protein
MSRLSLQVFYLWRHVLSTAPPFILWWSNLEILFGPLHRSSPFMESCAVNQFKWNTVQREPKKQSILWDVYVYNRQHPSFILWWPETEILFDPLYTAALPSLEGRADNQFKWDTVCIRGKRRMFGLDTILMSMSRGGGGEGGMLWK